MKKREKKTQEERNTVWGNEIYMIGYRINKMQKHTQSRLTMGYFQNIDNVIRVQYIDCCYTR